MRCMLFGLMLGLAFGAAAAWPAHAESVEISLGGWRQDPNGMLNIMMSDLADTLDLEEDLDYQPEYRLFGRLKLETPLFFPNIYVVAAPMEFEESSQAEVAVNLNGEALSADADLNSTLTLNQYDLALYYSIPALRTATDKKLNLDLGVNVRWIDFSVEIRGESPTVPDRSVTTEESLSLLVPMLFASAQFRPNERFSLEAEARGLTVGDNSLYSLQGRIRYSLVGPAFIAGGYRYDAVEIDEADILLDADFSGPFIEFGLKF